MTSMDKPFTVSRELAALKHEKKNHGLHRLPPNATVQRRPLSHPPVASPFAGSGVQKVVYVSRKTPVIAAVKRVKKLLHHVEKRATQNVDLFKQSDRAALNALAEAREQLVKNGEEVLVKASGRAMEQALRVGDWFLTKEKEVMCKVEVRSGNVSVVDDIIEAENSSGDEADGRNLQDEADETGLTRGDTTMEPIAESTSMNSNQSYEHNRDKEDGVPSGESIDSKPKRKRKRKKRPIYAREDLPEARIRWIKTVEVAISLRG